MKRKFAARHIDAEKTNDEKIVCEYKKKIQITIIKRQILSRATINVWNNRKLWLLYSIIND